MEQKSQVIWVQDSINAPRKWRSQVCNAVAAPPCGQAQSWNKWIPKIPFPHSRADASQMISVSCFSSHESCWWTQRDGGRVQGQESSWIHCSLEQCSVFKPFFQAAVLANNFAVRFICSETHFGSLVFFEDSCRQLWFHQVKFLPQWDGVHPSRNGLWMQHLTISTDLVNLRNRVWNFSFGQTL